MTVTPSMRLDGLVAVVTGAGRGVGRASAIALAEAGADVVLMSRTASELEDAAADVVSAGSTATPVVCDITDARAVTTAFGALERCDVLVNSAGTNVPQPFLEVTEETLDRLLGLNVKATFLVSQAAVRLMTSRRSGGSVVMISSQLGHVGSSLDRTVYCATKHAMEGLTKAMAVELAPLTVRVNSVAPTFVETPMTRPFFQSPGFREEVLDRIPLGRVGQVEDVVGAVVFLASPAAAMITGASLLVDGGWTAQ